ncbi:ABC transporter substrate-binding protein [Corynebacterium sp. AOP40-9SA-29]|uniref:ABC transporter substrate-binding protein n=1 Tax=Corynebacterium sp. AOP40-9SA-29 TaxID=3457677 RepID=UPI0040347F7B
MTFLTSPRSRTAPLIGALLTSVLVLSSCSTDATDDADNGADGDGSAGGTSERLPAAEGATEYPLTLETAWGETVLEERPERIVLGGGGHDIELLTSLDVAPVMAAESHVNSGWALDALPTAIESTFAATADDPMPAEDIAQADPDLIIMLNDSDADVAYDQMSDIAPVLAPSEKGLTKDWEANIRAIGEALDLTDRAEEQITETEDYLEDVRSEHPEFQGKSVSFVNYYAEPTGLTILNYPGHLSERYFASLGFDDHPHGEEFAEVKGSVSNERVNDLDTDVIIMVNQTDDSEFDDFINSPTFQGTSAAQDDRVIQIKWRDNADGSRDAIVDGEDAGFTGNIGWAMAGQGPLSIRAVSNILVPSLAEKLGDS